MSDRSSEARTELPEGTERVVLLYDSVSFNVDEDYEPPEQAEVRNPPGMQHSKILEFEEGDEVPVDLVESCWGTFSDRLAALDNDGDRVDEPSAIEKQEFDTALFAHR